MGQTRNLNHVVDGTRPQPVSVVLCNLPPAVVPPNAAVQVRCEAEPRAVRNEHVARRAVCSFVKNAGHVKRRSRQRQKINQRGTDLLFTEEKGRPCEIQSELNVVQRQSDDCTGPASTASAAMCDAHPIPT